MHSTKSARLIEPVASGWKQIKGSGPAYLPPGVKPALVSTPAIDRLLQSHRRQQRQDAGGWLECKDWDGVVRFEGACAVLIEQLRRRASVESLDEDSRKEKSRIMRRILNDDAQIRYLAEPWLAHCEQKFEAQQKFLH